MLTGRVFITGGAGFLGRGIMRAAQQGEWDCEFVVYSRDEQKHYHARKRYPRAKYVIGSILDGQRMHLLMSMCDYVVHTAAIKYIPECEAQPSEAIRVNVDGSRLVMECAREAGVKRVCMISTDKAPQPINTYGMTKALVERLVFETALLPSPTGTEFVACRYGNVIGSTGSVWPVFQDQYARFGRLQVTNPAMTRFFMPINEAVSIVLDALSKADPGTAVIPQPKATRVGALADYITKEWHAEPYVTMGSRDGEKMHESMISPDEAPRMRPLGSRWLLHGPAAKIAANEASAWPTGMVSNAADELSPAEFVAYALDADSV